MPVSEVFDGERSFIVLFLAFQLFGCSPRRCDFMASADAGRRPCCFLAGLHGLCSMGLVWALFMEVKIRLEMEPPWWSEGATAVRALVL